jgi:hypothetical protein
MILILFVIYKGKRSKNKGEVREQKAKRERALGEERKRAEGEEREKAEGEERSEGKRRREIRRQKEKREREQKEKKKILAGKYTLDPKIEKNKVPR